MTSVDTDPWYAQGQYWKPPAVPPAPTVTQLTSNDGSVALTPPSGRGSVDLSVTDIGIQTGLFNIVNYGADVTGHTDSSVAVQAAIHAASLEAVATGAVTQVIGPPGVCLVQSLKTEPGVDIFLPFTVLQAAATNVPIFAMSTTVCDTQRYDVCVQAHALGAAGPAINTGNHGATSAGGSNRDCYWRARYLSNAGHDFATLFDVHRWSYGSVYTPLVEGQSGPADVWFGDNDGLTSTYNPNTCRIQDARVFNNTGITTVFDAGDVSGFTIGGETHVEGNAGAVVLIPGTFTTVESGWYESNANPPIAVPAFNARTANAFFVTIKAGTTWGPGALAFSIPAGIYGWTVERGAGFGTGTTWTDHGAGVGKPDNNIGVTPGEVLDEVRWTNGGVDGSYNITSAAFAEIDAVHLFVEFTAPFNGMVEVDLECAIGVSGATGGGYWALTDDNATYVGSTFVTFNNIATAPIVIEAVKASILLTGLSPGTVYTFFWGARNSVGAAQNLIHFFGGTTQGPMVMRARAVPDKVRVL
jgi:hypothetical protein